MSETMTRGEGIGVSDGVMLSRCGDEGVSDVVMISRGDDSMKYMETQSLTMKYLSALP